MEYKLNSFKTYKDNWITFVLWMIVALVTMLAIGCRWNDFKAESETETAWTAEVWTPWQLTEDGDQQEMPPISENISDSHERFKEMAAAYGLDASKIWQVENHYWLTESLVLCVTVSETSWWHRWAWGKNIWSVGSNDRWDRPTYALMESWLEAIWKTLTNKYLGKIQTLGCLSNAWHCQDRDNSWYKYATSTSSWEKNMVACLSKIYWPINPATFNIRNR